MHYEWKQQETKSEESTHLVALEGVRTLLELMCVHHKIVVLLLSTTQLSLAFKVTKPQGGFKV